MSFWKSKSYQENYFLSNYHFNLYCCQENTKLWVLSNQHKADLNPSVIFQLSYFQGLKLIFHQCKFYPSRKIWPALLRNWSAVKPLSRLLSWSGGCGWLQHFQQPVLSGQAEQTPALESVETIDQFCVRFPCYYKSFPLLISLWVFLFELNLCFDSFIPDAYSP